VAQEILTKLGASADLIMEVCEIVGHHHHPGPEGTLNFKVVYDADLIVNWEEKQGEVPRPKEKLTELFENSFFTASGRNLAKKLLITTENTEHTEKGKL